MTHVETIKQIQGELIGQVLKFMDDSKYHMVEFKQPFKVFVEQDVYYGDYILTPVLVRYLYEDGTFGNEEDNYNLKDLSLHEIGFILDLLEAGKFTVDEDDEFIDPAGGQELHSHN